MPWINFAGKAQNLETERIYSEFKQNLRGNMESGDKFVTGPMLLDRPYIGGWKIHIGLGFDKSTTKEATLEGVGEFSDILQNYSNRVLFKVGAFEKLERLTDPANEQAGKGMTIYIPGTEGVILPWLIMEMRNFVDCNRKKLTFVRADQCSNFPIYLGGVISIRWATFFSPQGPLQRQLDAMERSAQAMCVIAEKAGVETFWSILRKVL